VDELGLLRLEEQLDLMAVTKSDTVVLSAKTRKVVVFDVLDTNATVIMGPPGRLLLSGLPY